MDGYYIVKVDEDLISYLCNGEWFELESGEELSTKEGSLPLFTALYTYKTNYSDDPRVVVIKGNSKVINHLKESMTLEYDDDREVVVTAAVKVTYRDDGELHSRVFLGVRHHAALQSRECYTLRREKEVVEITEGFVTNKLEDNGREYRFVDRKQAMEIFLKSKQPRRYNPSAIEGVLYSEDIY